MTQVIVRDVLRRKTEIEDGTYSIEKIVPHCPMRMN